MSISARIIEDTMSPAGARLTSMELRYPKPIHGELMTHRVFSRNASSSRAIPTKRLLATVRDEPFWPVEWGKNQKGMQARELLSEEDVDLVKGIWSGLARAAADASEEMAKIGLHKQLANRVIEPWTPIIVIVTSTEWSNFFGLRCDPDAQPEMRELGWCMADEYYSSTPRRLDGIELDPNLMGRPARDWHLPFTSLEERSDIGLERAIKASTARCARVSYMNHDGTNPDLGRDMELHDFLFQQKHMSPFEHQATPLSDRNEMSRNFRGWHQYRAQLHGDVRKFNYLEACMKAGREPKHQKFEWWNR